MDGEIGNQKKCSEAYGNCSLAFLFGFVFLFLLLNKIGGFTQQMWETAEEFSDPLAGCSDVASDDT